MTSFNKDDKPCFLGGEYIPLKDANVNIQTHALQYGTACIGGIRGYWNDQKKELYLFRIEDHFKRLSDSAKILFMKLPYTTEELVDHTKTLVQRGDWRQNIYIRPILYKSSDELTPIMHLVKDDFAMYIIPLNDYIDVNRGIKVSISSWCRLSDNQIPARAKASAGYLNSSLAKTEAVLNGYDEAIFLDESGSVAEGSAENLFIVRENTLITPDVSSNILEGIVRKSVVQLAKDMNIRVIERRVGRTELYSCDEAFFVGSGVQIAWIKSVDQREINNGKLGEITRKIQNKFFKIVCGYDSGYGRWLTRVYQ